MYKLFGLLFILFTLSASAQYPKNTVKPTSADERMRAVIHRVLLKETSAYLGIEAQNIGPTIMSGRVVDVAVNPANTKHFFVAYATGGVWETKNNGQSFKPIFDNNKTSIHCGALAVNWDSKTIYVGTGEANSSRSSYAGHGLFVGNITDTGTLWHSIGLEASQHISRIIIHPDNPKTLFVACMGNLFSPNKERGVYKSEDGGVSWKQVLYVDENTSAVDLEINPKNSKQLIAAMWQKSRRAWNFWGSGENSGVYLSNDSGNTWEKSKDFPSGPNIGRIGLSVAKNGVVFALFDNQGRFKKDKPLDEGLTKRSFLDMTNDSLRNIADSTLNEFLKDNRFPSKYKAKDIKKMVKKGELVPKDLYDFLADANAALFEDPVIGAELWSAGPFGNSWRKRNTDVLENVFYSYGYYFGTVHVNYSNSKEVYIAGVPLLKSTEGGTSFEYIGGENVHVDHHFIWVNPEDPLHIINGNDGGINISYDGGEHWTKCNSPSVGQFYTVAVDTKKNYSVYGGLQDNGVWKGPNNYKASKRWLQEGQYPYKRLMGGDGMQIQIDSRDNTVYTGYQFGHYFRQDPNGKSHYFHPTQDLKEPKLRWNWQTPILISSHNQDIVYMGSNKLHRSLDKAEKFKEISHDLTQGEKEGNVAFGTLTSITESPLKFGLIYTGSDDGLVHVTKDGGEHWTNISKKLPKDLWVRTVLASKHKKERVYVVLHGNTWDHFAAYVYRSDDYGKSWKKLGTNLPNESLNCLVEDPFNEEIIYVASDAGLYVSNNFGEDFSLMSNMPPVAIHAMVVQEKNRDLIVGTHGRGIYKIQLEPVYQSLQYLDSGFYLLQIPNLKERPSWGTKRFNWEYYYPSVEVEFFVSSKETVEIQMIGANGEVLVNEEFLAVKGYNKSSIELKRTKKHESFVEGENKMYYPSPGEYKIRIISGNQQKEVPFEILK